MKRRANFIWTPDQKIDHEAYFRLVSTEPIHRDDGVNRWALFRKAFQLPSAPSEANIKITCDGRYQLFVNGKRATRGPSRASPHFMRYDEVDITPHLHTGDNILAVLVHSPGVDLAWYETAKGAWQPVFGDGGLYVDLTASCGDEAVDILSDDSWRCMDAPAWRRDAPKSGWGQDFIEDFDANLMEPDWQKQEYADREWPTAQIMVSRGTEGETASGRGGHEPFPCLLPREIPQLGEATAAPTKVIWTRGVAPRNDLPIDRQLYDEAFCDAPIGMFIEPEALLHEDGNSAIVTTSGDKDASFMLAFDPYITGYPFIDIEANGGEIIEVAAAEMIPGEFTGEAPGTGKLKSPDFLTGAHLFRYHARPGRQQFEKFEWTAVRALQINVRNAPDGVKIHHAGVTTTNYPAKFDGAFECSDRFLNSLWRIGRHTALNCMHDAYEDCPGREKRQWVGDGVVHFDIAAAAFGPSAYPLGRQFIHHAAESQRPDGLVQMYAPGDHRLNGVNIPDFTLHWIRSVENYWLATGDADLAAHIFPYVEKALQWFARHVDDNDLLANVPFWHFIEWAHVGRSGEAGAINALYAGALKSAATLADAIRYPRAATRYREQAARITDALLHRHWNEERRAFVDEVDPETGEQGTRISQQTNTLMIALDLAPRDKWNAIIAAIADKSALRFTATPPIFVNAPPFDEAKHVVRANTFFCQFLYEAFGAAGHFDLALDHMREFYQPMLDAGATTLWESFEPSASLCHVFSAAPVYQLSRYVLGVQNIAPGFSKVRIAPQIGDLDWAKGVYPTPEGDIEIDWRREGYRTELSVTAPAQVELDLAAPTGHVMIDEHTAIHDDRRTVTATFS